MSYNLNDLVKIVKQPKDLAHVVEGLVAVVTETYENQPGEQLVTAISEDGDALGFGLIPDECLAPETGDIWVKAKEQYLAITEVQEKIIAKRAVIYADSLEDIAKKYKLTTRQLTDLLNEVDQAYYKTDPKDSN